MNEPQTTETENAIVVREQPQQTIPLAPSQEFRNEFDVGTMLATVGKLSTTKAQQKVLFAPTDPDTVEIRPDGLIYLPWEEYSRRLTEAFPCNWALIPMGLPKFRKEESLVVWGAWLVIDGHLMGFAIGEVNYQPTNRTMSWGDACEGALSNALMRNCKRIGMHLDLWTPRFNRKWRENYAEQVVRDGRRVWQRRAEPLKKIETLQNESKDERREYWRTQRPQLVDRIASIPYYAGEVAHVLNSLVKLEKDGAIAASAADDILFAQVEAHASKQADRKAGGTNV